MCSYREQSANVNLGFLALGGVNVFVRNYAICRKITCIRTFIIILYHNFLIVAALLPYSGRVRYVVVQAPVATTNSALQISQVVVTAGGTNVALNKPCIASSQHSPNTPCALTVDGTLAQRNVPGGYHSAFDNGDIVRIDLQAEFLVTSVTYYNRLVCSVFVSSIVVIRTGLLL